MLDSFVFSKAEYAESVLGANDKNIPYIEMLLSSELTLKGLVVSCRDNKYFTHLFAALENIAKERGEINESEIFMVYQKIIDGKDVSSFSEEKISFTISSKTLWPKSESQRKYMESLKKDKVIISYGPAGTGKTFLAVCYALEEVLRGRKNRIILARPVVEAGETLGFLPGDLTQKLSPYLRPLYDAMEYVLPPLQIKRLEENGVLELSPLAYMRGRSFANAVVILDEAQNATSAQMKMFLTRLAENSKAIITGDPEQSDLKRGEKSGLVDAVKRLKGIEGLSIVRFSANDTVRSSIVRDIIKAYEDEDED